MTHRVQAIALFLEEKEPLEIARAIKHSLTAVERYIDTFCRVVYCQRRFRNNLQTALVVGASIHRFWGQSVDYLHRSNPKLQVILN